MDFSYVKTIKPIIRALFVAAGLALSLSPALTTAGELPTEPILRIEAGMHTSVIKRIGLSADAKLLATGSTDKTVRLWRLPEGHLVRILRLPIDAGNGGSVNAVALSPDGKTVAAGGWDAAYSAQGQHFVYLFDVETGQIIRRLGPLPNVVHELRFSPDGQNVAAGLAWENNGIRLWSVKDGKLIGSDGRYGYDVYGISFAADGRVATTSNDGFLRLYDSRLRLLKKVKAPNGALPFGVAFSPVTCSLECPRS